MEYDDEPEMRDDFIRGGRPIGRTIDLSAADSISNSDSSQSETSWSNDDVINEKIENLKKMLAENMNIQIKQSNINIYM